MWAVSRRKREERGYLEEPNKQNKPNRRDKQDEPDELITSNQ
jgi:hypothetical protein